VIKDKTNGFNSFGEFLVKVRKACDGEGLPDSRLMKTAGHMEIGEDSQGGFLVPEKYADDIFNAALKDALVRPRATVLPMSSDSLKVRVLKDSDRSSGIFGGITFKWVSEGTDKSSASYISKPALAQLELTAHKLVGGMFASNELEDDYGKFGSFMTQAFGQAVRFVEDDYFINGTGAGQPLGIINSGMLISPYRNTASSIQWEDIGNMVRRLLPDSWKRAVWLINQDALDSILDLEMGATDYLYAININERKLAGFPFEVTEKCPAFGSKGDIILADFGAGHYLIGDRSIEIKGSRHVKDSNDYGFLTDETFWRIVLRIDGQPLLSAPITPYRGAQTVSPFVALEATTS